MFSDELVKLPEEIKAKEAELLAISQQILLKKREIDLWELSESRKIAEAVDPENKKLYPNETIRTAELESRKPSKREFYQELSDLDYKKKVEEIELNYLNNKFKVYKTILEVK